MTPTAAHLLIRLYPRAWRRRYGREFEALLESTPNTFYAVANIAWSAMRERISPTQGASMNQTVVSFGTISRKPSAYLPLTFAVVALVLVLSAVAAAGGVVHDKDEGGIAHLWQILMVAQVPFVLVFCVKWLRRAPRRAAQFLAIQAVAVMANLASVFFLT